MSGFLLAHAGGWDEFLMFAIPAAVAIVGLRWAEKRARRRAEDEADGPGDEIAGG